MWTANETRMWTHLHNELVRKFPLGLPFLNGVHKEELKLPAHSLLLVRCSRGSGEFGLLLAAIHGGWGSATTGGYGHGHHRGHRSGLQLHLAPQYPGVHVLLVALRRLLLLLGSLVAVRAALDGRSCLGSGAVALHLDVLLLRCEVKSPALLFSVLTFFCPPSRHAKEESAQAQQAIGGRGGKYVFFCN